MVWGYVSQHHRTELVVIADNINAVHYREDFLLPHVVPFLQAHPDMTLQHDNATSHPAHSVVYLNPIEHVWGLLDRRVRVRAGTLVEG